LQPMYDILAAAINEIDPDRVIFFNPVTWDHGYAPTDKPVHYNGFSHVPGGPGFENRSVYAYHYYDYAYLYNGAPYFQSKVATAKHLGVVGMVTEFSLENVETEGDEGDVHFNYALDLMDDNRLSWMAWTYKGYYPFPYLREEDLPFVGICTGCGSGLYPNLPNDTIVSWPTAKSMARTYAQAVQGQAKFMHFDRTTSVFKLVYIYDPKVTAPTVIYVNRELGGNFEGRYANGVDVEISTGFSWSLDGSMITVFATPFVANCEVSVTIAPKSIYTI